MLVVLAAGTIVSTKTEATRIRVALGVVMITTKVLAVTVGGLVVSVVVAGLTILASITT